MPSSVPLLIHVMRETAPAVTISTYSICASVASAALLALFFGSTPAGRARTTRRQCEHQRCPSLQTTSRRRGSSRSTTVRSRGGISCSAPWQCGHTAGASASRTSSAVSAVAAHRQCASWPFFAPPFRATSSSGDVFLRRCDEGAPSSNCASIGVLTRSALSRLISAFARASFSRSSAFSSRSRCRSRQHQPLSVSI